MKNDERIVFRAERRHVEKLTRLVTRVGSSKSEILRTLVESASVKTVAAEQVVVDSLGNDNSAGHVLADIGAVV